MKKAVEAGGSVYKQPRGHGLMYQNGFADTDGYQWELIYMDESKLPHQYMEFQLISWMES